MSYVPNFPNNKLFMNNEKIKKAINENIQNQPLLEYEDTIFKVLADDIKQSQNEINIKLDSLISENSKSKKKSRIINIFTLIIAILTLLTTIIGSLVQFL